MSDNNQTTQKITVSDQGTIALIKSAMRSEEARVNSLYLLNYSREDFALIPASVRDLQEGCYRELKNILDNADCDVSRDAPEWDGRTSTRALIQAAIDLESLEQAGSYQGGDAEDPFYVSPTTAYGCLQVALSKVVDVPAQRKPAEYRFSL